MLANNIAKFDLTSQSWSPFIKDANQTMPTPDSVGTSFPVTAVALYQDVVYLATSGPLYGAALHRWDLDGKGESYHFVKQFANRTLISSITTLSPSGGQPRLLLTGAVELDSYPNSKLAAVLYFGKDNFLPFASAASPGAQSSPQQLLSIKTSVDDSSWEPWQIALIVVGCVVFVTLVALSIWGLVVWRRRRASPSLTSKDTASPASNI